MLKQLWRTWHIWGGANPLDSQLRKAVKNGHQRILIPWNRGLGDIPLGLYAIVHQIRTFIPDAEITFLTRPDLEEGFKLLKGVQVKVDPSWKRGTPYTLGSEHSHYDLILQNPNPSQWVAWQRGYLVPKLHWDSAHDHLCERFQLPSHCIGAHVQCETSHLYRYTKDWPEECWKELFASLSDSIILFGLKKTPTFDFPNVIVLRGEMSLHEMLSIIKNRCRLLIAPDSGILGMTYYLDTPFPLKLISLWADPNQGILKQNVPSPNPLLQHIPLISSNPKSAACIPVSEVRNLC